MNHNSDEHFFKVQCICGHSVVPKIISGWVHIIPGTRCKIIFWIFLVTEELSIVNQDGKYHKGGREGGTIQENAI